MTSIRKLVLAAFLPLALVSPSAHAHATSDVAVVVGAGTITPGLPTTGCANQEVSFGGTAVNASIDGHQGVYNVSFHGFSGICETLNAGSGSGTLSGDVSGDVTYGRTGSVVTISGSGAVNGAPHHIDVGVCLFIPTSVNPVASYALVCAVVLGAGS